MYRVFVKNLEGFEKIFMDDERLNIARPLYLLKNLDYFNRHKYENTPQYQNLYVILERAGKLKSDCKYHSFGMFLNELELQYYQLQPPAYYSNPINQEILDSQLGLLYQFMFPAYYL